MEEREKIKHQISFEKEKTQLKKEQFIKQMRSGLGDHLKHNGHKVKKIKKSFWRKALDKISKII